MVSSRQSHHQGQHKGNGKIPIQESQWINHGVTKQPSISTGLRNVINALGTNDHNSFLETFLRRLVREEVDRQVHDHLFSRAWVNNNDAGISGSKPLELCFIKKLPDTIFTRSNIIAEDESPIQIALFDVRSQSIVSDGPLSSIKVEICAINGEFGSYGSDDWTETEFNANILREREGKEPLLVGERLITLKNGVGCINKITFTDNSRWLRSGKFRLGAKVVQPIPNGENIKGGRSESFVVKDNRGEPYKKHYPPYLNDEIWRLVKIAKQGKIRDRLSLKGIHTVKDLLKLLIVNESSLHEKFGNIPRRSWLAIIEHAKSCVIDDYKLYSYHSIGQPFLLLFNAIYELVGVTIDGQNYYSPDTLTPSQKHLVEIIKQHAYKNVDNLEPIDEALLNSISLAACLKEAGQSDSPVQDRQYIDTSTAQGQNEILPGYIQPSIPASYIDEGMHNCQIDVDSLPDIREILQNSPVGNEMYNIEGDGYGSHFPVVQGGYLTKNENIDFFYGCPSYTMRELENDFSFGSSDGVEFESHVDILISDDMDISSSGKPKAVWCKILAALKWVISVRRHATARKNAELFYCNN